MSGMFKSKKITPEYYSTPADGRITETYNSMKPGLESYNQRAGKAYGGEMVAGLTGLEQGNLDTLANYLNSPYASSSELFKNSAGAVNKMLGEDPWAKGGAIDYTQGRLKKYLTEDLLPATRQGAAATGGLYSSGAVKGEQQNVTDIMDQMAQYAYWYESQLNGLKAGLAPTAMGMADYQAKEPWNRINNTMEMAGTQRTQVDNPRNSAEYNDYLNQMQQLQAYLSGSISLAGQQGGSLAMPSYQPSAFSQYVMPVITGGMQIAAAAATGGASTAIPKR